MKKTLRVFKWIGLILVLVIITISITVWLRQNLQFDAPYPEITASVDSAIIAKGRTLVYQTAHCASCHGPKDSEELLKQNIEFPLLGGNELRFPIGSIYIKNITPDTLTGIGGYTDAEIARILRYGVHKDGTAVLAFMPFHNMSDEDLTAIISYLRSQRAVRNYVPPHKMNFIGKAVKAFFIKPIGPVGDIPRTVQKDTTISYGKYLSENVTNCSGCHTEKNFLTGQYIGEKLAGGGTFPVPGKPPLISPNISADSTSRIYKWDEQTFVNRFRAGKLIDHSPMPWTAFSKMDDIELKAIYKYLKSVKH